jgi:uncharacterized protein (TIGR02145 family)
MDIDLNNAYFWYQNKSYGSLMTFPERNIGNNSSFIFTVLLTALLVFSGCEDESVPQLSTLEVTDITSKSAESGGNIIDDNGRSIIARGVCWSLETNPTISDKKTTDGVGNESYSSTLFGLNGSKTYYVRAYATNKLGTGYGNEISFQTAPSKINFAEWITYGNVADKEGNSYRTAKIGEQTWMAENLRATKYLDGNPIQNVTDINTWTGLNSGAYCVYNNNILNKNVYGVMYNWFAVGDQRKICPVGWHVPSDSEWTILTDFLGGKDIAGMKMKEAGLTHWASPNSGGSNLSGFTALPAGSRYSSIKDDFLGMGYYCTWWSSSENNLNNESAWFRSLSKFNIVVERNNYWKIVGFSVRCIQD